MVFRRLIGFFSPASNAFAGATLLAALTALTGGLGACFGGQATTSDGAPATGGDADASTDDGPSDPYDTPVTCTSNTHWTRGDRGSASMHPGGPCVSCHKTSGGQAPSFTIGGTVYPSAHEPIDCNGAAAAQVVITDAKGKTLTLSTTSAGNFNSANATIALPYHAKVVANGKERAMSASQTSGDCNSCHTEAGANNAPGRILLP